MINRVRALRTLFLLFCFLLISCAPDPQQETGSREQAHNIPAWFKDGKFGMFIHWGPYSILGGEWNGQRIEQGDIAEWIMQQFQIPVEEYRKIAATFNPTGFNAREWVSLAKKTGMKYIIITSKHHDGFAMYDSQVSDYNIVDYTPFKRDPIRELAEACAEAGIKFGVYYSHREDWEHPYAYGNFWDFDSSQTNLDTMDHPELFRRYLDEKSIPQLTELLTEYGPLGVVWFDRGMYTQEQGQEFADLVHNLQPGALVNGRVGHYDKELLGDYQSMTDNGMPISGIEEYWETPQTLNDTWGYSQSDNNWKTPNEVIRRLVTIVSKGGNYLLNVGPTGQGIIPSPSIRIMNVVGDWMQRNSESIYGTSPSPFPYELPWGYSTRKGNRLFLHVFDWPGNGQLNLDGLNNEIKRAYPLLNPEETLTVDRDEAGVLTIGLPAEPPDDISSVFVLEINGDPDIDPYVVEQTEDGRILLDYLSASTSGDAQKRFNRRGESGHFHISKMQSPGDFVEWNVQVNTPGTYQVDITYAARPGWENARYVLEMGPEQIEGTVQSTQGWYEYKTERIGQLDANKAGRFVIRLYPEAPLDHYLMYFNKIELLPTDGGSTNPARKRQEALVSALGSLTLHISGDSSLKPSGIAEHKSTIDANQDFFGASRAIIAASFELVKTYDTEFGPLWVPDSAVKNFMRAEVSDNDIHWAVYTVMQNIIDKTYTGSNIVANEDLFSGFKFGSSAHFPGACEAPEDPDKTYTATINASFLKSFGRDTMYWTKPARKPTGLYLAPGTVATVSVPQALVGKGYQVRVGSHSWDLFRLPELHRLDRVSLLYDINATKIQVSSPLGGGIYIEVPYLSDNGIVELGIKNAVPSPYFSAKPFHTTSLEEWKNTQRLHKAPWADFQTEKFMMNVPTDWVYKLEDPVSLLAEWDMSMDATNELMGFPVERGKETLYAQVDLAIPYGFHATGYPAVNAWYDPNEAYGGTHDDYLVTSPKHAGYVELHEMGHGYLFPKLESDIESTVNLLHVAALNRKLGFSMDEAFQKSAPSGNASRTVDNAAVFWMMLQDFNNNKPMNARDKSYQHQGHAGYVEVARLFGWDVLANYWKAYMLEGAEKSPVDNGKIDSILLRLSKAVGVDIRPLFHFWGVHPDKPVALQEAIDAEELSPSMDIYTTLKKYQSLVPRDKGAFQDFALKWWDGKEDQAKNKYAAIWDTYDETYASLVQSNVQNIIDQYFPAGPPEVIGADDSQPPTPNPMSFSTLPTAAGEQSISMVATQAADDSWVQYYFTNTAGDGHDSGWQGSRVYEDTGLNPDTVYAYTVRTRDYSPAQNTSAPSGPFSARTKTMDNTNPLPGQMSMKVAPVATSPSTIYMEAITASDASGVEYYFACTAGDCHDSGWQQGVSYTDTGLKPAAKYSYTVTVRDKSPQGNKTSASAVLSATTKAAITGPYLVMGKPVYGAGEDIVVHYVATSGKPSVWVGIFSPPTKAELSDSDGIQFQYLEEKPIGPTGMINGNLVFNGMAAGSYQARLHYNDDYPVEARIEFMVK